MSPLDLVFLVRDYWFVGVWAIAVILAYRIGGKTGALAVATLGAGIFLYMQGRKSQRDDYKKQVEKIEEKREKAYEEINNRNTDRNAVIDRLRNRSY